MVPLLGLEPRPPAPEAGALSAELQGHVSTRLGQADLGASGADSAHKARGPTYYNKGAVAYHPRQRLRNPSVPNTIRANIIDVRRRIARAAERSGRSPMDITLVAATKYTDPIRIREAFQAGVTHFGENRVQEAQRKLEQLHDIREQTTWHMIGHLQANKAKASIQVFDIIQSVDSQHLGQRLDRLLGTIMPVLLEVNVAGEATKSGFAPEDVSQAADQLARCANLDVRGLMTIAPAADDPEDVRWVFRKMRDLAQSLGLPELSMGMTGDLEVAVEEGATIVRVGRAIFGER